MGALLPHATLRRFRQPLAARRTNRVHIVNRNEYDVNEDQMPSPQRRACATSISTMEWKLTPKLSGNQAILEFDTEATATAPSWPRHRSRCIDSNAPWQDELMTAQPLAGFSHEWKTFGQQLVEIAPTKPLSTAPAGMIRIDGADFEFRVEGIEIEGTDDVGVDVQYPWENAPRRFHEHKMHLKPYFIDKYPVTNSEFKKFLTPTRYKPADDLNFLKDWQGGAYPEGWANKPVTWVSIEDARRLRPMGRQSDFRMSGNGNTPRQGPGESRLPLGQLRLGAPGIARRRAHVDCLLGYFSISCHQLVTGTATTQIPRHPSSACNWI